MSQNDDNLTNVERALADLQRADSAGMFRPTPLDTHALLDTSGDAETPWIYRYRVGLAAASVLLAAGVWVAMFAVQIGDVHELKLASARQQAPTFVAASIQTCATGPQRSLPAACKSYDTDTDGDVDLADISSFQLAYAQ